MSKNICSVCQKKIKLFSRIISSKCKLCGSKFHLTCGIKALDFSSYSNGRIRYIERCCSKCAEDNSVKFNENRFCKSCGVDITIKKNAQYCEVCRKIGHSKCYNNKALKVSDELDYIYPHLYDKSFHKHICTDCAEDIETKINKIKSKLPGFVKGTRHEDIRGYRTIKTLGRIEYYGKNCSEPADVENYLTIHAVQLGGNGYVKFYWEKHSERHSEEYLAGISEKGNPYYKTRYWTKKWFTGYATAVYVEPLKKDTMGKKVDNDFVVVV